MVRMLHFARAAMSALLLFFCILPAAAQTTLTTVSTTTSFWSTNGGAMTFGITNSNSTGIIVTDLSSYLPASTFTATYTLWYNPTNLTGAPTIDVANGWIQLPVSATLPCPAVAGITPIFSNMNFLIPANTTYRVAFVTSSNGPYYGNAGGNQVTTAGGVSLLSGQNTTSPTYYGGFPSPPNSAVRYFYGSITFVPATPCIDPPTPGSATVSNANPCLNSNITLGLTGNSSGQGQTYQWESSPTLAGPYTSVGSPSSVPSLATTATTTQYYRAQVTCGATTLPSAEVLVTIPALFPAGTYTIDKTQPTAGTN
jgi:hypothetical protein